MKWVLICVLACMLCACVAKKPPKEVPQSPYQSKVLFLNESGHQAMRQQHWMQAKMLFYRAKTAAELADHTGLVSASWYNIAMAHVGAGHQEHALYALKKAKAYADPVGLMRIRLARLLLQKSQDSHWLKDFEGVKTYWPLEVALSAARLAQQQHLTAAESLYVEVLNRTKKDKQGLLYQAQAWLGLALMFEKTDVIKAQEYANKALDVLHQLAQPALNAHVLWLLYRLEENAVMRTGFASRACKIYIHLKDKQGIDACREEGVWP